MGETQGAYIDATLIEHARAGIIIDLLALSWHMNKSIEILRDLQQTSRHLGQFLNVDVHDALAFCESYWLARMVFIRGHPAE